HPHANGIVERINAEIMKHLRAMVLDIRIEGKWSEYLAFVQRIINTTWHSSLNAAPATVLFGKNLETECAFIVKVDDNGIIIGDYLEELAKIQSVLIQLSKMHLDDEAKRRESNVDTSEFDVKDWVLLRFPGHPPNKLSSKYRGPFRVVKIERPDILTIVNIVSGKEVTVHIDRVIPFHGGEKYTEEYLTDIAASDEAEYTIESIVDHRKARYNKLEFLVSWLG